MFLPTLGDPRARINGDLADVAVLLNCSDYLHAVQMSKIVAQHEKADCVHSQSQSQSQSQSTVEPEFGIHDTTKRTRTVQTLCSHRA